MFGFKTNSSKSSGLAFFSIAALAGVAALWLAPHAPHRDRPSLALVPDSDEEKAKNAQCVRDVCSIVISKDPNGPDVNCDLAHRWDTKEITLLSESKDISWSLGPARCSLKVSAKRAEIFAAVTSPEYTLKRTGKSVACEVGAEGYEVSADVTADFTFKDGVVTAISLGGSDFEGPIFIAKTLFVAWGMEKKFGTFQGDMLREANRFIKKECPKVLAKSKLANSK